MKSRQISPPTGEHAVRVAQELALEYLEQENELPRPLYGDIDHAVERLGIALGREGVPFDELVEKLRGILAATPSTASRRFFNQLFGGREPVATLAEMLTPLTNTSMYTLKVAGPQVLVEREVVGRMAAKVGYPGGEGMLTPGGSMSNLTAMIVARNEIVPGIREGGFGGRELTLYTSDQSHYSILKGAGIVGVGRGNVRRVPTDERGHMIVAELERVLETDRREGRTPFLIVATAGTTVLGAFDPLPELARVAREAGVWLHVDGTLGGTISLCEEHRHLLEGSAASDSFTWNAHKMMGVPLVCSAVLFRERGLLMRNFYEEASYLFQVHDDELNPGTRSMQCGRRNDALKLWTAWQYHGDAGYDARVSRLFRLARRAAKLIEADPELTLSLPPESINVCFEVVGKSSAAICERLDDEARLKISHGPVNGRRAIRLVCVNADLEEEDLERVLVEIKTVAAELPAGDNRL